MADTTLNVKQLLDLGRQSSGPQVVADGIPYAVIPSDCKMVSLADAIYNKYRETPVRKQATVKVLDGASFIEYYNLFSDPNSRVFADETASRVLAILDYHGAGTDGGPRWGEHRIQLDLRLSEEWLVWNGRNGQENKFTQMEFAEFIEDNTPDITTPDAATMLEMARTLEAKTEADFSSAIRLNNGQVQFTYSETVKGTYGSGKVEIPEEFLISIPVYVGSPRISIRARLRYRINSGKLAIWYDLLRVGEIERKAFMTVLQEIKDGLKVGIINGSPA